MKSNISLLALSLSLVLAGCSTATPPAGTAPATPGAAVQVGPAPEAPRTHAVRNADSPAAIPGQYIVVLSQQAGENLSAQGLEAGPLAEQALIRTLGLDPAGLEVQQLYSHALHGFAGRLSAENLERLQQNPAVKYIEQDARVTLAATQSYPDNWGLDRADQRDLPLDRRYNYTTTGRGVTAYIVDSGINTSHQEFGGRASWGGNATGDGKNYDCNSHGTHVAGTVGGSNVGVAKNVNLVAVKVLGCDGSGSVSGIVAGLDWVRGQYTAGRKVINMSINSYTRDTYQAYADAINRLADAGVPVVNSAANQNDNACYHGPADVPAAIVVAATDSDDYRADFSNYGSCVDLFAPGVDILSASNTDNAGYLYMSGTSMAAPHVAGAVARILEAQPDLTVAQVQQYLINTSTKNVVSDPAGSPNRLLYLDPATSARETAPAPDTTLSKTYTAALSQGQQGVIYPDGVSFTGTVRAEMTASSGTDFDLYLQRWNGSAWVNVAASEGSTSTESVTYNAASGSYRFLVYAYSGNGTMTLKTNL